MLYRPNVEQVSGDPVSIPTISGFRRTKDVLRRTNIDYDDYIFNATEKLALAADEKEASALLDDIRAAGKAAMSKIKKSKNHNINDYARLVSSIEFGTERAVMPLLFRSNDIDTQVVRALLTNGAAGETVDMIDKMMRDLTIGSNTDYEIHFNARIRGAVQELTAAALLNDYQDGQIVALPAFIEDDYLGGIDLDAYYTAKDGYNYRSLISIKSSNRGARETKQTHPHLVVLSASDFNNYHLDISRLLVKRNAGSPGLNDVDRTRLDEASRKIHAMFAKQVDEGAMAIKLPEQNVHVLTSALKRKINL